MPTAHCYARLHSKHHMVVLAACWQTQIQIQVEATVPDNQQISCFSYQSQKPSA